MYPGTTVYKWHSGHRKDCQKQTASVGDSLIHCFSCDTTTGILISLIWRISHNSKLGNLSASVACVGRCLFAFPKMQIAEVKISPSPSVTLSHCPWNVVIDGYCDVTGTCYIRKHSKAGHGAAARAVLLAQRRVTAATASLHPRASSRAVPALRGQPSPAQPCRTCDVVLISLYDYRTYCLHDTRERQLRAWRSVAQCCL